MSALHLVLSSLKARALNSFLSVMLTALGVTLAVLIILFSGHLEARLGKNAQGIDFVIGAKGSPLQLVLSSVYHVDIPTGNIPYEDAARWIDHKRVKKAIPLALGDSYKGFRIAGTHAGYIDLYDGSLADGLVWDKPFEAVVGAATGLDIGDKFLGSHGLISDGHTHDENPYVVTGRLQPSGTVLDRLILTDVDSVLMVHGQAAQDHEYADEEEHSHDHDHHEHENHDDHHAETHGRENHASKSNAEITALLITVRSPVALMNLPRTINRDTNLQAAVPAYEMARLTSMLGVGSKTGLALAVLLIMIAGLSIFAGIAGTLDNRLYDLAVMRALGFSAGRLSRLILCEGLVLVSIGLVSGLALGHVAFYGLIQIMEPLQTSAANAWRFSPYEGLLCVFILMAGLVASFLPAWRVASMDVGKLLARG